MTWVSVAVGVYVVVSVRLSLLVADDRSDGTWLCAVSGLLASLLWLPVYVVLLGRVTWRRLRR